MGPTNGRNTVGGTSEDIGVTEIGPAHARPVLLLHPWWGVTPAVLEWADEIAAVGRRVVVPDLYGGRVVGTVEEAEALAEGLDHGAVLDRLGGIADGLADRGLPWAAMGFSLGAFFAARLAGRGAAGPDELVLFYGGRSPGGEVGRTRRVELHLAPQDPYFTEEEVAETVEGFRRAGLEPGVHVYEGAGHWFAERGSPAFDEDAHALARSRVLGRLDE
jgi:carboxymethylenebutenolidase